MKLMKKSGLILVILLLPPPNSNGQLTGGMARWRAPRRVRYPGWRGGTSPLGGWIVTAFALLASHANPLFKRARGRGERRSARTVPMAWGYR